MSRLPIPATIADAPAAAQPLLDAVKKQIGSVPNLFRVVANSPAGLEGYLGLNAALGKGTLPAQTRERIALAVAELNGCSYCLSAHSHFAGLFKLDGSEILAARRGGSADPKAAAAVAFAVAVARARGHVSGADLAAVKAAGYSDGAVIEIVLHVALNTLTNYVNEVANTEIDFPVAPALQAAA